MTDKEKIRNLEARIGILENRVETLLSAMEKSLRQRELIALMLANHGERLMSLEGCDPIGPTQGTA